MDTYKVNYCSIVKNKSVITLNKKLDLSKHYAGTATINKNTYRFSLTHNESIVILDTDTVFNKNEIVIFN